MKYTENILIHHQQIKQALLILDKLPDKVSRTLFVTDEEGKLLGTLTDGDVRRGLLSGTGIDAPVESVMNKNFRFLQKHNFKVEDLEQLMEDEIQIVPLLDESHKILRLIDLHEHKSYLPIDAVIMAGGRGERLKPLTDTVAKPMLMVGSKPIIEHNIDRLAANGINNIYITLRYLGQQLVDHFSDGSSKGVKISYVEETEPLGTIGAVGLLDGFECENVLIMNSDLLTTIDYVGFYKKFINENADMAVATVPHTVNVPFAVLETDDASIISLREKPSFTFQCNAGIYLVKRKHFDLIPKGKKFDATDLIDLLIKQGNRVVYYSVLDYWLDIGSTEDFYKAQNDIKLLKL
jgi:dTDP-glucose pyrophosphorylase